MTASTQLFVNWQEGSSAAISRHPPPPLPQKKQTKKNPSNILYLRSKLLSLTLHRHMLCFSDLLFCVFFLIKQLHSRPLLPVAQNVPHTPTHSTQPTPELSSHTFNIVMQSNLFRNSQMFILLGFVFSFPPFLLCPLGWLAGNTTEVSAFREIMSEEYISLTVFMCKLLHMNRIVSV